MKAILRFVPVYALCAMIISCGDTGSYRDHPDTVEKTTTDTAGKQMIPGTPGPSGTNPKPGDTTQAHKDSLEKASHITTPSTAPESKP